MKISVEQNDGKGQNEHRVRGMEAEHDFPVALAIASGKDLDEPLDLLRLPGHPEVGLELP